ncbi:LOW QUALITY PROTEIN: hypothetical protein V2J09_004438 [Rumex salicifolius]
MEQRHVRIYLDKEGKFAFRNPRHSDFNCSFGTNFYDRKKNLVKELDTVLEQVEVLWLQKSREKWITLGDRNTSFFHMSTIIHRRRYKIDMLKNDENVWVSESRDLEKMVVDYFPNLYTIDGDSLASRSLPRSGFVSLSRTEHGYLEKPFTCDENRECH